MPHATLNPQKYVDKERAPRNFSRNWRRFWSFLGYNPLLSSIEVKLYADYANTDSIAVIEKKLKNYEQVNEVFYQKSLVHLINDNVKKISFVILLFSALLAVVAVSLINNTIRLSIYAKRFLINTMQLVGATNSFIKKPFYSKYCTRYYWSNYCNSTFLGALFWAENQMRDLHLADLNTFSFLRTFIIFGNNNKYIFNLFFGNKSYVALPTNYIIKKHLMAAKNSENSKEFRLWPWEKKT
jgi:hypothetical protein